MKPACISVAVADLQREPLANNLSLRETQVLYADTVLLKDEKDGDWIRVSVPSQQTWNAEKGFHDYEGWIHKEQIHFDSDLKTPNAIVTIPKLKLNESLELSYGTMIYSSPDLELETLEGNTVSVDKSSVAFKEDLLFSRETIIANARMLLDYEYSWGGLSTLSSSQSTDCSGLIYLVFRTMGVLIPRNAHDQFLFFPKTSFSQLQAGDLLFIPDTQYPMKKGHVMLYCGGETCIEAIQSENCIREITFEKRWACSRAEMPKAHPLVTCATVT
jgi:cell wall-associated NlpC family hydrolase